jgi:hypothetical protein
MEKILIYKITRSDGKQYIGQAIERRISRRMSSHRGTKRFRGFTFSYEILDSSYIQEEVDNLEEMYILKYDTYNNGLNNTKSGKGNHNAPSFTTKGWKMPQEVKDKISTKLKGKVAWNKGKAWGEDVRRKFSTAHKGKCYRKTKLCWDDVDKIREDYSNRRWTEEFRDFIDVVKPNGRKETYENLFSKKYAEILGVSQQNITHIIKNKSWNRDRLNG